jgi:hypothetical protein
MADPGKDASGRKTGTFTASEARDALVKKETEAERNAFEARTVKLRALRLAKEADDAAEALKRAAEAPPKKAGTARKKKTTKAAG